MQIVNSNLLLSSYGSSLTSDRRSAEYQLTKVPALLRAANPNGSASPVTIAISTEAQKSYSLSKTAALSGLSIVLVKDGDSPGLQIIKTEESDTKESSGSSSQITSVIPAKPGTTLPPGWSIEYSTTTVHEEARQLRVSISGTVTTEDGRKIAFALDLGLNSEYSSINQDTVKTGPVKVDPLVINFSGGLPGLADTKFSFDINSDGSNELVSATAAGSGFLALDSNGDGKINNGSELFGPATGSGYSELSKYDDDQNGWIDANDAIFAKLSIWTKDEAGNDKLLTLKEAGIGALSLNAVASPFSLMDDTNQLKGQVQSTGIYLSEQGKVGAMQQIDLAASAINANLPTEEEAGSRQQTAQSSRTRVSETLAYVGRMAATASVLADKSREIRQSFKEYLANTRKGHGESAEPQVQIPDPIKQIIKTLEESIKTHSLKKQI
jgi:hypothetical protein